VNPLVNDGIACLRAAGFDDVVLLEDSYDPEGGGRAHAIFRVGRLLVRLFRDRSWDLVGLASPASPDMFYDLDDLDVAMGWKSMEEIMTRPDLEPLRSVLGRLFQHRRHLEDAFSAEREPLTRARLMAASKERGDAFLAKIPR
jgi:hypothetical protein